MKKNFPSTFRALSIACLFSASLTAGAAEIVVGQVASFSGLESYQGLGYSAGIQLALKKANAAGGVNGNTFTLVRKDDGGRGGETLAATRLLLKEKTPLVLAGYIGARGLADLASSGLLAQEKIALVGYRSSEIREEAPLIYNVRAGLAEEVEKLIEQMDTVGMKRVGLFYQDGPGAPALLALVEKLTSAKGITLSAKGSHVAGSAKVADAVIDAFATAKPQGIIMMSSGAATAEFIEKYGLESGKARLFAHSGTDIEQISQRLGEEQMRGLVITQVTPNPYKITGGGLVKDFNDAVAKEKTLEVPVSYAMIEGYIVGTVIVDAARRMGPKVSRQGFVNALEGIGNLELGGYKVGYQPGKRSGSKFVELSIVTAKGNIRQ